MSIAQCMFPLSITMQPNQYFQWHHLLHFCPQILKHQNVLLLLKDVLQHLSIREHRHHWATPSTLKCIYNRWLLVLGYAFVISLRLLENSCWSRGKRIEYLKQGSFSKWLFKWLNVDFFFFSVQWLNIHFCMLWPSKLLTDFIIQVKSSEMF